MRVCVCTCMTSMLPTEAAQCMAVHPSLSVSFTTALFATSSREEGKREDGKREEGKREEGKK